MDKETKIFGIFTLYTFIGTILGGLFGLIIFALSNLLIYFTAYDIEIQRFESLFILVGGIVGYKISEKVHKNYIEKHDEILGYNINEQQLRFFNIFSEYNLIGIAIGAFAGMLFSLVVYVFTIVTIILINEEIYNMISEYAVIVFLIGMILGAIIGYFKGEKIARKKQDIDK